MASESFFKGLADSFARPFTKTNLKRLPLGLLFMALPFTSFIAEGDAYSMAAGESASFGRRVRLGLKMILVRLLYAGPPLFFYGVDLILCSYFRTMPLLVSMLLILLISISLIRFLVLSPIACCALALGAPFKVAASGKEMKRIVSASFGRFLVYSIIADLMYALLGLLAADMEPIPQLLVSLPFAVLFTYIMSGFYMSCCRKAFGLPLPPRDRLPRGTARRFAALFVAATVAFSSLGTPVHATGGIDPGSQSADGEGILYSPTEGKFSSYEEAYSYFYREGLMRPDTQLEYNHKTGTYQLQSTNVEVKPPELLVHTADVVLDFVPYVGNVKNGIQAVYYADKAFSAESSEERQEAAVTCVYKTAGIVLSGVLRAATLAKKGAGYAWIAVRIGASGLKKAADTLELINKTVTYYDRISAILKAESIITGSDTGDAASPNGLFTTVGYLTGEALTDAFTTYDEPHNVVYTYVDADNLPDDYQTGISGDTPQLDPGIKEPAQDVITQIGYDPRGSRNLTAYMGAASVPGLSFQLNATPAWIDIRGNMYASFNMNIDLTMSLEIAGTGSGTRTRIQTQLYQASIPYDLLTGKLEYTFTQRMDVPASISYYGKGYANEGGTIQTTYPMEFVVTFTVYAMQTGTSIPLIGVEGTVSVRQMTDETGSAQQVLPMVIHFTG